MDAYEWVRSFSTVTLIAGFCLGVYLEPAKAGPPVKEDALPSLTQNWDKNISSVSRFTVLTNFGGGAVRDDETGLVWEKSPDATAATWTDAALICANKIVGNRKGCGYRQSPSWPA